MRVPEKEKAGRALVRINGHCQMACAFCFVDRGVGDLPAATVLAAKKGIQPSPWASAPPAADSVVRATAAREESRAYWVAV